MGKGIGAILKGLGYVAWVILGMWGFVLCLVIINHAAGFWGIVVGFVVFPVTFLAAPWYAGITMGNWFPLLICYGGGIIGAILVGLGSSVARD